MAATDTNILKGLTGFSGAMQAAQDRALKERLVQAQLLKVINPAGTATQQEYAAFQKMPPEQQQAYLDFVRAKTPSYGGEFTVPQNNPAPQPTPSPQSTPQPDAVTQPAPRTPDFVPKEIRPKPSGISIGGAQSVEPIDANERSMPEPPIMDRQTGAINLPKPTEPVFYKNARDEYETKNAPAGYAFAQVNGQKQLAPIPGFADSKKKPLPAASLKLATEEKDAIGTASSIAADLSTVKNQLETGKIDLGFLTNRANYIRNATSNSTEKSRNYDTFKRTITKLINDSLRLNKGVQTEGDAIRAAAEITSTNDNKLVAERIGELMKINERAVTLRKANVEGIYNNYGLEVPDLSAYTDVNSAIGGDSTSFDTPESVGEAYKSGKLNKQQAMFYLNKLGVK